MTIITKVFSSIIMLLTLFLSVLFLLRGHNFPGGGFIGALIASTGVSFYMIAHRRAPAFINKNQILLINLGMVCIIVSILLPLIIKKTALTGMWLSFYIINQKIKLGTPLLFDLGIYFSILGSLSWIINYLESARYD